MTAIPIHLLEFGQGQYQSGFCTSSRASASMSSMLWLAGVILGAWA
jgi:hypothetical protein